MGDDDAWRTQLAGLAPLADTPGADYLASRAIPLDLATAAGGMYAPSWLGRAAVTFPVRDRAGALVAAQGRYLDAQAPKARTAGHLAGGVFASPGALDGRTIVVAEAPLDALSLAACGIPAVALCGTSWPAWLPQAAAFKQVLVALDADAAGDAAAAKLTTALVSLGAAVERLRPAGGKDWAELLVRHGVGQLRRSVFDTIAGPQWAAAWRRYGRQPHAQLEAAIDTADLDGFRRELVRYGGSML